jgi:putative protein-disulfide isomerase
MINKPSLIYIFDPLCSWSYGFHPVIIKLVERFKDRLDVEVVCGGLAVGEQAQPVGDGFPQLEQEIKQVEKITGTRFGDNFKMLLNEGSYMFDSLPPSKAITAAGELIPETVIHFGVKVQQSLFRDGKNLNELETYFELIEEFDAETDRFLKFYNNKDIEKKTTDQFEWCRNRDLLRFPTLMLRLGDETGTIAKGYRPYETLESHLHHLLNNIERLQD